jgi:hypothetical protein
MMQLSKQQQETYDNLMTILKRQGKQYLFGWLLGVIISLATHDPNLRRRIKNKAQEH